MIETILSVFAFGVLTLIVILAVLIMIIVLGEKNDR